MLLGYGIEADEPCPSCNGTGEMIGNSEQLKSRSVQRREALQKGEKMPQFDKPEMPSESYYKVIEGSFTPLKMFIWQSGLDGDVPLYSCSELAHGVKGRWYIPEIYVERNYLPADKVREVVRLHEEFRDLLLKYRFTPGVPDELNAKAEEIDNLQSALFPEGV
jgi:hypothetical protein